MKNSLTLIIIKEAFQKGYKYDPVTGIVTGLNGKPLKMTCTASTRYPTFAISVSVGKKSFAVPCHKIAAYAIWGEKAFDDEIQVRHLKGVYDIRKQSLALGTRGENMADIPPEVRSNAAKAGRAAQKRKQPNIKLPDDVVGMIRKTAKRNSQGYLLPGELERLSGRFGISKSIISNILRGLTYKN